MLGFWGLWLRGVLVVPQGAAVSDPHLGAAGVLVRLASARPSLQLDGLGKATGRGVSCYSYLGVQLAIEQVELCFSPFLLGVLCAGEAVICHLDKIISVSEVC